MSDAANLTVQEFQQTVRDLRRDRLELEARLTRLSKMRAETSKLLAESKIRLEQSMAAVDACPSVVPDANPNSLPTEEQECL